MSYIVNWNHVFIMACTYKAKNTESCIYIYSVFVYVVSGYKFPLDDYYNSCILGVTDSKAVTGSKSTLDITSSTSSLVVIITGVATGVVFTILVVCLFVTCKRKVSIELLSNCCIYRFIVFHEVWYK